MLGGWQWTGVTQIQSGRPFTIGTGVDSNGDGTTGSDRPNINPIGSIVWDEQHASFVNNGYYAAPTGTNGLPLANALGNGNAPRNSERGARFMKTDFSLIKNFRVGGQPRRARSRRSAERVQESRLRQSRLEHEQPELRPEHEQLGSSQRAGQREGELLGSAADCSAGRLEGLPAFPSSPASPGPPGAFL